MNLFPSRCAKIAAAVLGLIIAIPGFSAQAGGPKGGPPGMEGGSPKGPGGAQPPGRTHDDLPTVADTVSHLTSLLTLTSAQQTQATTLLTSLHTSVTAAQTTFTTAFDATLTAAQWAIYNAEHEPDLGGLLGRTTNTDDVVHAASRLTILLSLTATQTAQATTLLTQFQASLVTAQSTFTTAFDAMLTTAQLALYQDESHGEGAPPFGTGVDFVTGYVKYLTSLLSLTTTQQATATTTVTQLQTAITTANSTFQASFTAILTAAQLALYPSDHGISPDGFGGNNATDAVTHFVSGLASHLTLSAAQQAKATTLVTALFVSLNTADTTFDSTLEASLTASQLALYQTSLLHDQQGPHP